jgi:hypothetical protein
MVLRTAVEVRFGLMNHKKVGLWVELERTEGCAHCKQGGILANAANQNESASSSGGLFMTQTISTHTIKQRIERFSSLKLTDLS